MLLREFLYVDVDKVSGILAQLEDGIPDTRKETERKEKAAGLRNNLIGDFGGRSSNEFSLEKSLGDTLFQLLEEQLEPLAVLTDISDRVQTADDLKNLHGQLAPGAIIRLTAPARLFHPEQLSHAMVGIGTAATGLIDMQNGLRDAKGKPPTSGQNRNQPGKARPKSGAKQIPSPEYPEDILFGLPSNVTNSLPRDFLIGMIRLVRGVFSEGVHIQFSPAGNNGPIITARLETGRRFLDSTPEVLFSRYGFRPQEWTVVGMVGHLAEPSADPINFDFLDKFNRSSMLQLVGSLLQEAGESGFIDLPTGFGFSVVPLAVYRAIGWTNDGSPEALRAIESPDRAAPTAATPKG